MKTRPYTLNTGTYINGTKQVGYIAAVTGTTINSSPTPWIMGPDEDTGYVIAKLYNYGLFLNGDFSNSNYNFSWGAVNTTNQYSGTACLQITGGNGASAESDYFLPVNTSETYQMSAYVRTLQKSAGGTGNLAGGHIGFSCYDKNYQFIALEQCGGNANTYLTRALNVGDTYAYVSNVNSGQWYSVGTYYFNLILIYPPTHPDYSTPHQLSRIAVYYNEITDIGGGEIRLRLANSSLVTTSFPNIGYATPVNTPISNGVAGGSYNYALDAPDYPLTWTKLSTPPFTGENRNSTYPFRWGTKYIKFLILRNYNHQSDNDTIWLLDNIYFSNTKRIY